MTEMKQTISILDDHILVERPPGYEVEITEQISDLADLQAISDETGLKKVLVVGPKTNVKLSPFDVLELSKLIAKLDVQLAIVELHDASDDAVELLSSAAFNRGSTIRFFDNEVDAKAWLEID